MATQNNLLRPYDGPRTIGEQAQLAALLAKAEVGIPIALRGDAGGILALILRASALDIPVMTAADNLVFDSRGTCAMRARLMKALVTSRAGHRLVTVETTAKRAVIRLEYSDGRQPFVAEWTIATAQAAGLVRRDSAWANYPDVMLFWRAVAKAIGLGCPEVTTGISLVEAMDDDQGEPGGGEPGDGDVLTDADGARVPSEVVAMILNDVATISPTGPVPNDGVSLEDLRRAWSQANTTETLGDFAWSDGDRELTLGDAIDGLVEQVSERAMASVEKVDSDDVSGPIDPTGVMADQAGVGTLPCGCDAMAFANDGHTCDLNGIPRNG